MIIIMSVYCIQAYVSPIEKAYLYTSPTFKLAAYPLQ